MPSTATREYAHELIDRIDLNRVPDAVDLLEKMLDPVSLAQLNAPWEDEEISEAENRVAAEARARGYSASPNSYEELLAEFGMTLDELRQMDFVDRPTLAETV